MARRETLLKSDQRRILFIGLGFVAMAYLLNCIIDASVNGENVYRKIFFPGSREIAVNLASLSVLFLFSAYVLNLLLKRRRLEEALVKYQAGMDVSIDGIAILNNDGECVYVNSSCARLYGYDSHRELTGRSWLSFYGDGEAKRFNGEIFPSVSRNGEWRGEAVGMKRQGTVFPQEISLSRMDDKHTICIVRDITRRKNFEEELERKARELSATNRDLESFSYSLTHDMRNYLTRSSSAAQLLQENCQGTLGENDLHLVRVICDANQGMEELINDMLVLSRLSQSEIRREMVDLSGMGRSIAAELSMAEPERMVQFVVAPELVAEGDSHLLKIALGNLLGNAWKYTRKVPETRVEFGMVDRNGKKEFFVRDNGLGFEMKDADRLFEPFQRLQNAKEFPGTGIGLATVQRIIQRHGGEVWGEGDPGKGAVFYFTLQ
ncbi:MAG: hypothetical protein CXR31_04450 [Geobacter sp.]|nr:MAG: hypothetical protein CXR31_04450 [Geobacter sp.]